LKAPGHDSQPLQDFDARAFVALSDPNLLGVEASWLFGVDLPEEVDGREPSRERTAIQTEGAACRSDGYERGLPEADGS